jgi:predicted MPP superfamily phosphohydrolase
VPSRRQFLSVTPLALGAIGAGLYSSQIEPYWLEIVERPLRLSGLPAGLRSATLVHLSDLHVGTRVPDEYILETFARVRALEPAIVAYTGDFVSYESDTVEHARRIYRDAPHGRIATVGVLGNHDYGPDWSHPEVAAELADLLDGLGITILRNELTAIDGLQLVGLDDLWGGRFDCARGFASLDSGKPALALSHNPDTVDLPGWDCFRGYILSGHTHGGQCKAPFLPPPVLPVKNRRYTSGEFGLSGDRRMYISRGVGHVLGVRFNVRPEVTVFQLQAS